MQNRQYVIELDRPSGFVRHFHSQHLKQSREAIEIDDGTNFLSCPFCDDALMYTSYNEFGDHLSKHYQVYQRLLLLYL